MKICNGSTFCFPKQLNICKLNCIRGRQSLIFIRVTSWVKLFSSRTLKLNKKPYRKRAKHFLHYLTCLVDACWWIKFIPSKVWNKTLKISQNTNQRIIYLFDSNIHLIFEYQTENVRTEIYFWLFVCFKYYCVQEIILFSQFNSHNLQQTDLCFLKHREPEGVNQQKKRFLTGNILDVFDNCSAFSWSF